MNLLLQTGRARPEIHSFSLAIEENSSTQLALRAGMFRCQEQDYEFTEDQFYDMPPAPAVDVWVSGYVAKEVSSGDAVLIVDEVYQDGEDLPIVFEQIAEYDLLYTLFWFKIPAGQTELTSLDVTARHVEDFPEG